jgi:hypothetical protein
MNARLAIALVLAPLACLAVSSCGGGGSAASSQKPAGIPHRLGLQLAGRTSAVELRLNSGDTCAALDQATNLERSEAAAIASGQIPAPLRRELLRSTEALVAQIQCNPPPPPSPADHHHHKHGPKKHGNGEGD